VKWIFQAEIGLELLHIEQGFSSRHKLTHDDDHRSGFGQSFSIYANPRFRPITFFTPRGDPLFSRFQGSMLHRSQFSAIFDNFRRKKLAFFSKTNVMIKSLHNLALFRAKNANFFRRIIRRKYLKNHHIGPSQSSKGIIPLITIKKSGGCSEMLIDKGKRSN
jgi:hypothetical protein